MSTQWEKEFEKLFLYRRAGYMEFDVNKSGGVGALIDFIRSTIAKEVSLAVREKEESYTEQLRSAERALREYEQYDREEHCPLIHSYMPTNSCPECGKDLRQ